MAKIYGSQWFPPQMKDHNPEKESKFWNTFLICLLKILNQGKIQWIKAECRLAGQSKIIKCHFNYSIFLENENPLSLMPSLSYFLSYCWSDYNSHGHTFSINAFVLLYEFWKKIPRKLSFEKLINFNPLCNSVPRMSWKCWKLLTNFVTLHS